jgi:alanine racemase
MTVRAWIQIDLTALQHNFSQIKQYAPQARIMAMVKANAYGHGALQIAAALPEADAFGVATLQEAISLRQSGIRQAITVMGGFTDAEELSLMVAYQLTPLVHCIDQVSCLANTPLSAPLSIWLKIDTGMHRLGFLPAEVAAVYNQLSQIPSLIKPIGFMTHLACADMPGSTHTQKQIALFNEIVCWEGPRSLARSAAVIAWPDTHADWIRPGIMLYGISPFVGRVAAEFNLKPVMSLYARIMSIKTLQQGVSVGYAASWVCPEEMQVGLVSIGYGDGYPRHAPSGTPVLVNGKRAAVVGRVSMDVITIDLRNVSDARVGDRVLLWGPGLPAEEIAQCAGTIAYELTTKITSRVSLDVKEGR